MASCCPAHRIQLSWGSKVCVFLGGVVKRQKDSILMHFSLVCVHMCACVCALQVCMCMCIVSVCALCVCTLQVCVCERDVSHGGQGS